MVNVQWSKEAQQLKIKLRTEITALINQNENWDTTSPHMNA